MQSVVRSLNQRPVPEDQPRNPPVVINEREINGSMGVSKGSVDEPDFIYFREPGAGSPLLHHLFVD
jgi:hypothetical protein